MNVEVAREKFSPAVQEIIEHCLIEDKFVDKDLFQVYICTIWGNAALEPEKSGLDETDLPILHDYLNEEIQSVVGQGTQITDCFEYLMSKKGEEALARLQVSSQHREFIEYFGRLILST
jgi:hypothetical protein